MDVAVLRQNLKNWSIKSADEQDTVRKKSKFLLQSKFLLVLYALTHVLLCFNADETFNDVPSSNRRRSVKRRMFGCFFPDR